MTDIANTLQERGSRYGEFAGHASVTYSLKRVIQGALDSRGKELDDDMLEALDMVCHKIGRIINGDPTYADSWIDIAGYAKLVADRLEREQDQPRLDAIAKSMNDALANAQLNVARGAAGAQNNLGLTFGGRLP